MSQSRKIAIGTMANFPRDEVAPATLPDGTVIAVYNVAGTLYASADLCTHGEASLSEEGTLNGTTIECAWHAGTFDVTTGLATGMPCEVPLKTYAIHVLDGNVYVEA